MKPSVTVSRKISVETAQKTKVCSTLAGPYSPKVKETCQTTSVSRIAIRARPDQKRYRFRIALLKLYGLLCRPRQTAQRTFKTPFQKTWSTCQNLGNPANPLDLPS